MSEPNYTPNSTADKLVISFMRCHEYGGGLSFENAKLLPEGRSMPFYDAFDCIIRRIRTVGIKTTLSILLDVPYSQPKKIKHARELLAENILPEDLKELYTAGKVEELEAQIKLQYPAVHKEFLQSSAQHPIDYFNGFALGLSYPESLQKEIKEAVACRGKDSTTAAELKRHIKHANTVKKAGAQLAKLEHHADRKNELNGQYVSMSDVYDVLMGSKNKDADALLSALGEKAHKRREF